MTAHVNQFGRQLYSPSEAPHIGKLTELFPVHAVLKYPVSEEEMRAVLQAPGVIL